MIANQSRLAVAGLVVLVTIWLLLLPPLTQNRGYHEFADTRTLFHVSNFWNVLSNVPFLLVALYGLKALQSRSAFIDPWERTAYCVLLAGTFAVGLGSAYYHLHPDDQRLFWDRLPMTIVFTSLVATTLSERMGERWLLPLVLLGIGSVLYWRYTGDLRLYALVQFGSMLALAFLIARYPPRYTHSHGVWIMGILYLLAKLLELLDHQIAPVFITGGHPWKHVAGAAAIYFYVNAIGHREPLTVRK